MTIKEMPLRSKGIPIDETLYKNDKVILIDHVIDEMWFLYTENGYHAYWPGCNSYDKPEGKILIHRPFVENKIRILNHY